MDLDNAPAVITAVARRHDELASMLIELDDEEALAPSLLPGWNRLTVICHLRYGAEANLATTNAALAGEQRRSIPSDERHSDHRPSNHDQERARHSRSSP